MRVLTSVLSLLLLASCSDDGEALEGQSLAAARGDFQETCKNPLPARANPDAGETAVKIEDLIVTGDGGHYELNAVFVHVVRIRDDGATGSFLAESRLSSEGFDSKVECVQSKTPELGAILPLPDRIEVETGEVNSIRVPEYHFDGENLNISLEATKEPMEFQSHIESLLMSLIDPEKNVGIINSRSFVTQITRVLTSESEKVEKRMETAES